MTDVFTILAEPRRREIVDVLRQKDCSVNDLVTRLGTSQPAVSKHLRVLRDCGLVSSRAVAQQRIYRLEVGVLRRFDTWLAPYRAMWNSHTLDNRPDAPSFDAGWHLCIGELTRDLDDQPSPPVAGNVAIDDRWADHSQQYANLWGI